MVFSVKHEHLPFKVYSPESEYLKRLCFQAIFLSMSLKSIAIVQSPKTRKQI